MGPALLPSGSYLNLIMNRISISETPPKLLEVEIPPTYFLPKISTGLSVLPVALGKSLAT